MPALQLLYQGVPITCGLDKIDRAKLYGYVDTEVLDEQQRPCRLATLASDGRTLLPAGGVAQAYLSPNGMWRDKSELMAVDFAGVEIEPVPSTFKVPVALEQAATAEDVLDHNIRMSYLLSPEGEGAAFPSALLQALEGGAIFRFPFSYRGGLTADTAFVLRGHDGGVWMLVGKKTAVQLIGFEQQAALVPESDSGEDDESEDIDFGMM
ncbi:MAG: hypothetical protein ACOYMN_08495 [Roseimicrobium sp.]